jgi:hypothetical protein
LLHLVESSDTGSNPIVNSDDARLLRAVGAAIEGALRFDAMADDPALTVRTRRRERMNCAFEAIENVGLPGVNDFEGLVVIVPADLALGHGTLLAGIDQARR